jgi:hypothetical protein
MARLNAPHRYHPSQVIHDEVFAYAFAGLHPWPCIPRGCDRPISEWTIPEFIAFMAGEYGVVAAAAIRIIVH